MAGSKGAVRIFDRRRKRLVTLYPFNAGRPVYLGLAAWLALGAALELAPGSFGAARAAEPPPADGDRLPDLSGKHGGPNYNFSANGGGASFNRRDADSRLSTQVESSQRSGSAVGISAATALGDTAALGGGFSYGAHKREAYANLGWTIDAVQRLMLTGSQLRQNLEFDFPSGRARADLVQNSGGLSYRLALPGGVLDHLELNAYQANTASRELGAVNYAIDTATLYELWRDPRRVAGGRIGGIQGNSGLTPWQGGRLDFGFGQERLRYDLLAGAENHTRGTARFEASQALTAATRVKLGADAGAAQTRYSLGLDVALEGGRLGLAVNSVRGRDGAPNDQRLLLSWTLPLGLGARGTPAPFGRAAQSIAGTANAAPLVDQVAVRPGWIPSQVVAVRDKTAAPARLIAIDKTALPAGSSVAANGAVTTPLAVAVTGIAGVTRNAAAFANAGQFALSGNSLVVNPALIVQPAVGVIDIYVVTLNNLGGGTTLVTVNVSHGSVKIDSIVVSAGAAGDTTAPTTTAVPAVANTTATGTTLTVTIDENGTGYYLVQAAAAAAPSVATVQASGTAFAMTANVAAAPAITGLTAATAYKIYFVAKDAANNVQAAVQNVAVTTAAAANNAPSANNFSYGSNIDNSAKTFSWLALAAAADADGDTLTATVPTQGTKGSCVVAGNNVTYTPNSGQTGNDSCTLRINDGHGGTRDVVATLNGIDTYAAPPTGLAFAEGATTTAAAINFTAALTAGADTASWFVAESATAPAAGAAGWSSTKPTAYTLTGGYGNRTVYVYAKDVLGNVSAPVSAAILYDRVPTGPALADVTTGDRGGAFPIDPINTSVGVSDADGDSLAYSATGLPAGLSIDPSSGLITGTIDVLGDQVYAVTVTVSDGHGGQLVRSFTLTITDQG